MRSRPVLPRAVAATCATALAACTALGTTAAAGTGGGPGRTADPVAEGVTPRSRSGVVPGIEILVRDSLHLLRGKRVGLITNHTGRARDGTSAVDLLHRTPGVTLVALFGPEHGLRGAAQAGEKVAGGVDSATGVVVHSLYGETRVPTPAMLRGIDVLVYDIQDVGARVYTYPWTMALAAEAAGKAGITFVVADRPDPIGGTQVEGGVLDTAFRSFVGQYPVAMRYGLTAGELLRHLVRTGQVQARVHVVPAAGWRRGDLYDATGLPWIAPSPNLRTLEAALLYPGTVFFEGTTLSEGRGTEAPFQLVGAPWLDARAVVASLRALALPGVAFDTATRTIAAGQKHGGTTIPMVSLRVTDRAALRPVDVGAWLLFMVHRHHPRQLEWRPAHMDRLAGTDRLRKIVTAGDEPALRALLHEWRASSAAFERASMPDRLYR